MAATTAKAIAGAAGSFMGPVGALAGPIIGGLFGRSGQDSANKANLAIARENRAFQERMSNTAYQRSTADLQKSGLNRILALGQPATTPAGNIATMQNKNALLAQGINQGVTSGLTARRMNAEIKNIDARTGLVTAQRNAIGGAAEVGTGLEEIIIDTKRRLSPKNIDYGNIIKQTPNTAKQAIQDISKSLTLNPQKAENELIKILNRMDLPKMSRQQKLAWALKNPNKIRRYMDRSIKQ